MNNLPAEKNRRVLVVDDNPAIHDDFRKILAPGTAAQVKWDAAQESLFGPSAAVVHATQFEVDSAYQGQEGVQLVAAALAAGRPYAMAFVDVRMGPGWDGVETSRKIWELDRHLQVVLCTAYSDYSWDEMFEKLGQRDGLLILKKPFDAVEAFQLAHALTEKWSLHQQARRKLEELEGRVAERTQELVQSLSLLNATLESTTDGIVVVDLAGTVVSYNTKFANTWRFPADTLARRDAAEMRAHTAGQVKNPAMFLKRLEELQADPEAEGFDVIELKDGRTFERYVFPQRIEHQCVGSVINWRDITERKRAEEELLWKTAFLEAQVNSSSDGIVVVDPQGKKALQNQRMIDLFKIPPAIAAANVDTDQLRWVTGMVRSPEQFVEKVSYLYAHPAEISRDEVELKDGTVLDRYSAPVMGKDGQSYGRIWTFRDITERRRAELAVRESEALFAAAFEHAPIGVALVSPAGRWLKVNRAVSEVVGYSEAELLTRTFQEITHPDDLAADLEQGRRLLAGEIHSYQMEKRYVHQRGHLVTVLLNVSLVRDAQDQPRYYISQVQDITARKAAEFRLLEALAEGQRLRAALDQVSAYIYMKDLEGRYTYANRRTLEFFGCSAAELEGRSDHHFFPPEAVQRLREVDQRVFQGQETNEEIEIADARGERSVYLEVKSPLYEGTGDRTIVGLLGVSTDITERQREEAMVRDSKRFLQSTLDALSSHIAILDEDGRIVEVNAAWQSFARANQFIGGHWGVGVNYVQLCESASGACSVEAAAVAAGIRSVMAGRQDEFHLEYPCHSPQEQRWFIARVTRFGGAGPVRVVVAHENITERKQAENAVRASDEKFRQLADHITDAFWIRSPDLREVHYISPAFEQIWGRPVASLYANPQQWADFILPEDRERVEAAFAALTGAAPSLDLEYRIVRPNGEIRWVRVRGFQVRDAANHLIRHAGIVTDITERKQADEVLRRTEAVYRAAIVGAGAVPYSSDYQSKAYLFMGEGIEQLIGYAPPEVTGQLWKQIIQESIMAGEAAGLSKDEAARRMASGEIRSWRCDMRVRTRDGKLRWIADAAVQHLDAAGRPVGSMGILQDITERKQNEIFALAFSKLGARLSSVNTAGETFDIIKEVSRELFGWDAFCIRLYNAADDAIYSGFTIDTIAGQPVAQEQGAPQKPGELYRRIMARGGELIRREQPTTYVPGLVPFGDVARLSAVLLFVPIRSRGAVVGILSVQSYTPNAYNEQDLKTLQAMADQCGGAIDRIWADETLRKTEAQLLQAQKLETIGKLAGGIAHEFNSIMTVIIGQSELLLSDLPAGDELRQNATEIRKAADRAAILTRQLLAYGRKQILQPEILDLNLVLTSLSGMIRHLLGSAVDVKLVADRGIKSVKVDAGQMELVIVNIVMNAADAMPHGGRLTLETARITLDQNYVGQFPDLKAGDYVLLAITDTGTGMREEVKARVFEPFFTTKAVGKGPGLGLSTCHGIIKQSGGHIAIYSEPGRGTTVKIYLPEVAATPPVALLSKAPRTTAGTETILLVEDDPALREMAAQLLGRLGYRVLAAGDGAAAVRLAQQPDTGRVDLLFTDVVMPLLSGPDLAEQVRSLFPGTKILFTSAYTEGAIVHQGVLAPGVEFLLKPFTPAALAEKVRALLDQPVALNLDCAQQSFGFENPPRIPP